MKSPVNPLFRAACISGLSLGLGAASLAHAENHALIMWIGEYKSDRPLTAKPNLPGIDIDARNARAIAAQLGVRATNLRELSNAGLTHEAIGRELQRLASGIKEGDNVFIYFSGHGHQVRGASGQGCSEGMVPREMTRLYSDEQLSQSLAAISTRAGQVVMLNDSCFSGGAASKSVRSLGEDAVPKVLPEEEADKSGAAYQCGDAVNKSTRNLFVSATGRGNNMLYLAASADNEVAFATNRGSVATLAWLHCLRDNSADTNRSGGIDGEELRACAQSFVRRSNYNQTITLVGNSRLPLSFASASAASQTGRVDVRQALEDFRASASPGIRVTLGSSSQRIRIGQDKLDFTVTTSEPGHLYLLHVGSDGKTYNLLLPNQIDQSNYLPAGTHRFPRPSWQIMAAGPAGTSHVMAVLSTQPKQFESFMSYKGAIADAPVNEQMTRNLIVTSTGAQGGKYGASNILSFQEY